MGKRIERYFAQNIGENIEKLIDNQVIVILKSNLTYKAKLVGGDNQNIFLAVKANKKLTIEINEILEIQTDRISLW
jgi:small nuclear ribonucleoprotein (snRNP)-like protein